MQRHSEGLQRVLNLEAKAILHLAKAREYMAAAQKTKPGTGRRDDILKRVQQQKNIAGMKLRKAKLMAIKLPNDNVKAITNATQGQKKSFFGKLFRRRSSGSATERNAMNARMNALSGLANAYGNQIQAHVQKYPKLYPYGQSSLGDLAIEQAIRKTNPANFLKKSTNNAIRGALQNAKASYRRPPPAQSKEMNPGNGALNRSKSEYPKITNGMANGLNSLPNTPITQNRRAAIMVNANTNNKRMVNASTQANNITQNAKIQYASNFPSMIRAVANAMGHENRLETVEAQLNTLLHENLKATNVDPMYNDVKNAKKALAKTVKPGGKFDSNTLQKVLRTLMYRGDGMKNFEKNNAFMARALTNAIDRGDHAIVSDKIRALIKHRGDTFDDERYPDVNTAIKNLNDLAKNPDTFKEKRLRKALRTVRLERRRLKP